MISKPTFILTAQKSQSASQRLMPYSSLIVRSPLKIITDHYLKHAFSETCDTLNTTIEILCTRNNSNLMTLPCTNFTLRNIIKSKDENKEYPITSTMSSLRAPLLDVSIMPQVELDFANASS